MTTPSGPPFPDLAVAAGPLVTDDRPFPDVTLPFPDVIKASSRGRDERIAVVGGGLSGLTAAWALKRAGFGQVTVFEATERLGGRVHTLDKFVSDKIVEAGAELIGQNHPRWQLLAKLFGLKLAEVTSEEQYDTAKLAVTIRFGNYELSKPERLLMHRVAELKLLEIARDARPINSRRPWEAANARALDNMSVSEKLDKLFPNWRQQPDRSPIKQARRYIELLASNDQCLPPGQQSYLGLLATVKAHYFKGAPSKEKGLLGFWNFRETQRCTNGSQELAHRLARSLNSDQGELRMRTPVRKLEIGSLNVRVVLGADGAPNGDGAGPGNPGEYFGYVILAAPPRVWPAIESSPRFHKEYYIMADGPAVKFLSSLSRRFWLDSRQAPKALWDRLQVVHNPGGLGSVWEATDEGPEGLKPSSDKGAFCLTVFSGGSYVLPDIDSYARLLPQIYQKYADYVVEKRLDRWRPDGDYPWVETGYSIPAIGQVCTIAKNLSQPYQGRLFFAGEQCSPGFFGHMEGALDAGHRAAAQVALTIARKWGERGRLP